MTIGLLAALGGDLFIYGSTQGNPLPELCLIVLLVAWSMYLCIRIHALHERMEGQTCGRLRFP